MDKSRKVGGVYYVHRRTTWFLWKEAVKPSDIHLRLSAIVERKHLHAHCVQLCTELKQWQGNRKGGCTCLVSQLAGDASMHNLEGNTANEVSPNHFRMPVV